jgi:hypothetical protein
MKRAIDQMEERTRTPAFSDLHSRVSVCFPPQKKDI